jgi:signal transduction histidine kinase
VASLLFGLFVLADLALFGWLIFRSLSQREVEQVLGETRQEAESLAERIARHVEGQPPTVGRDLFTAVTVERDTATYIDGTLAQRDLVEVVEVYDRDGVLVYRKNTQEQLPAPGAPLVGKVDGELPPQVERRTTEHRSTYDVTVPIADLGQLRIGISQGEMARRIERLRSDLVRQTAVLAAVTVALLGAAFVTVWGLWRRGRRLEEQKAEAERLAYVGTLASGLAHEIRNPLNSLNLNMQLLEEDLPPELAAGPNRRLLALTRSELGRLEGLVTDFLAYARPRPLELEVARPRELFEQLLAVHGRAASQRGVAVEVIDEAAEATLRVDRSQLEQLLLNLFQNALAATEDQVRQPLIELRARRQGGQLILEVSDNGRGMAPDELARVFEVFYSTKKGGTGLGLAIVERIARAHGGALAVRSEPGEGTTVSLSLPVYEGSGAG